MVDRAWSLKSLHKPKSASLTSKLPSLASKRFSSFTSRCTIPEYTGRSVQHCGVPRSVEMGHSANPDLLVSDEGGLHICILWCRCSWPS